MDALNQLSMTGQGILGVLMLIFVGSGIIQIAPIKINPWSAIAKSLGKVMNEEVITKVDDLDKAVTKLRDEIDEDKAITARVRILRFNEEMLRNERHTKESFDQVLSDIDMYELYCETHKSFKNNKTKLSIDNIKAGYTKCMQDHDFL